MPENDDTTPNPDEQPPTDNPDTEPAGEGEQPAPDTSSSGTSEPAGSEAAATAEGPIDTDRAEGEQIETHYERTAQGHRVTHRTVRRREVTEDTEENITDTYPVPYQPPTTSAHPSPVG